MMFQPFMMQHPLMMQHHPQQQQVHGSPWGNAGMMQQQQQQGGAWYGGMQMGRAGMQMGMATPYSFTPAGFFPVRASGGWVGGWWEGLVGWHDGARSLCPQAPVGLPGAVPAFGS